MIDKYINQYEVSTKQLINQIENNKISHAYLFETTNIDISLSFIKSILSNELKNNYSINNIENLIDTNNFPDLFILETENLFYKKDDIKRLVYKFDTKPILSKYKIYIIKDADKLRDEVSNEMLKFIEEPEDGIIAILMTNNTDKIIDTIKSRCQLLRFNSKISYEIDTNKINNVINLALLLEKAKKNSIIYEKKFIFNTFSSKEEIYDLLSILKNVYIDLIFVSSNENPINYPEMLNKYKMFVKKPDIYIKNISYIDEIKDRIKLNCNLNLIIDKLIIGLGEN